MFFELLIIPRIIYAQPEISTLPCHVHLSWDEINGASGTIVITWKSSSPYLPVVRYGTNSASYIWEKTGKSFWSNACATYIHTVKITELEPEKLYYYVCGSTTTGWGQERTFMTGPKKGSLKNFSFIVSADSRSNPTLNQIMKNRLKSTEAKFIIFGGDIVNNGSSQSDWNEWFDIYEDLISSIPFFSCDANHENSSHNLFDQFVWPNNEKWYSFNYGNAHFIFLQVKSEKDTIPIDSKQYKWLENDLRESDEDPDIKWKFITFHAPVYCDSVHPSNTSLRETLSPLFEKYHVDMVFNGHNHLYERSKKIDNNIVIEDGPIYKSNVNGVVYITNCLSAPLHNISPTKYTAFAMKCHEYGIVEIDNSNSTLTFSAYNENGVIIDSCTIKKTGISSDIFETFSFIQAGDPQFGFAPDPGNEKLRFSLVAQHANKNNVPFVLIVGDLVHDPTNRSQVNDFDEVLKQFNMPVRLIPGNHDITNIRQLTQYRNKYGDDYYTFTYNNCDFFGINSMTFKDVEISTAEFNSQWDWFEKSLANSKAKGRTHIFVFMHYPPFLNNENESDQYFNIPFPQRTRFLSLVRQYGVRVIMCGHTHTTQIIEPADKSFTIYTVAGTARAFDNNGYGYRIFYVDKNKITQKYVTIE